jgi:hypothetical protein
MYARIFSAREAEYSLAASRADSRDESELAYGM